MKATLPIPGESWYSVSTHSYCCCCCFLMKILWHRSFFFIFKRQKSSRYGRVGGQPYPENLTRLSTLFPFNLWLCLLGNSTLNFSISWKGSQIQSFTTGVPILPTRNIFQVLRKVHIFVVHLSDDLLVRSAIFSPWFFSLLCFFPLFPASWSDFSFNPVCYKWSHSLEWRIYFLRPIAFHSNSLIYLSCQHLSLRKY